MISGGTTGLSSWDAALALAEWGCANGGELRGRSVLELGCGPGLAGLAIARACAPASVTLTDGNDKVLDLARGNAAVNCTRWGDQCLPAVTVETLDWTDPTPISVDVVVAADVVYDPSIIEPLVQVLATHLSGPDRADKRRPFAVVAGTERNAETWRRFRDAATAHGLSAVPLAVPSAALFPRDAAAKIHILKFAAKAAAAPDDSPRLPGTS